MSYTPSDVYIEPERLAVGYVRAAVRLDATLLEETPIVGFLKDERGVHGAQTSDATIEAPIVVLAAGGWLRAVVSLAGLGSLHAGP
jgi:glycine/D-amino acid oxidase-like deaminating enzyme